jgi:hypothetical protein
MAWHVVMSVGHHGGAAQPTAAAAMLWRVASSNDIMGSATWGGVRGELGWVPASQSRLESCWCTAQPGAGEQWLGNFFPVG